MAKVYCDWVNWPKIARMSHRNNLSTFITIRTNNPQHIMALDVSNANLFTAIK